ncbi:MAG: DMT family transporter [Thermodesulfobacteriota bacterium]
MNPINKSGATSLTLTGFLVVLAVCLLWGGSIPTIKVSEHGIPPLVTATGRIALATLLLFLYARVIKEPVMLPRHDFWHGVLLGVFFGFTMLFLYMGLVFTNAARGTIFYSTKPFWVAVGALIFEWSHPLKFYLEDLLAFGYQSLGAQFVAYIMWFWLIHRYPVSQVASFTFLVPLVGVILSAVFLGDPTPPALWLGLALVGAGIILVNWPRHGKS